MAEQIKSQTLVVRRLVEQGLEVLESRGTDALEALLQQHPEEAIEVRRRIESLATMGLVRPAPSVARAPQNQLGDFIPLERLGAGGMGVVWRASQPSLKREVALKVIHPQYLWFEGARERFRREAEAVAKLRHPAIVPIYAVGDQDGVPYLAFELIEGLALDRVLSALADRDAARVAGAEVRAIVAAAAGDTQPSDSLPPAFKGYWQDVALRIAIAVGDAIAHAHSRGVLHRDIKPSNVMLTPTGEVKLLDFGLACSEQSSSMTREGSAPGSLAYMAPELLSGEQARADVRSEVYALGVLLYEMLALRAPFEGGSAASVRARILSGERIALAQHHHGLPWELTTICEHAMERYPAQRYEDVTALVLDLQRFQRREAIHARRSSALRRAWRYTQRHPVFVTALGLSCALVLSVFTAISVLQAHEVERVRDARDLAQIQRRRAESSILELIAGVERLFVRIGSVQLRDVPGSDEVRRALLEDAGGLLLQLEQREGALPEIVRALAKARTRQADLLTKLGALDDATAAARTALSLLNPIMTQDPHDAEMLRFASLAEACIAAIARARGDEEAGLVASERSLRYLERAAVSSPNDPTVAEQLAIRTQDIALAHAVRENFVEAIAAFEQAEEYYQHALDLNANQLIYESRLVGRCNWSAALGTLGRLKEAEAITTLALADVERALQINPDHIEVLSAASTVWRIRESLAEDCGDLDRQREALQRGAALAAEVMARFPQRIEYRIEFLESQTTLSRFLLQQEERTAAIAILNESYSLACSLADSAIQRSDCLQAALSHAMRLTVEVLRDGDYSRGCEVTDHMVPFALELAQSVPERRAAVVRFCQLHAEAHARAGSLDLALAQLLRAHEVLHLSQSNLPEERIPEALRQLPAYRSFFESLPQ